MALPPGACIRCPSLANTWVCTLGVFLLLGPRAVSAEPPGRFPFRSYGTEEGLENLVVDGIAQDDAGLLWVTTEDGLHRFDGQHFDRFGVKEGLPSSRVTCVLTSGDVIWAGTAEGLARGQHSTFALVGREAGLTQAPISALAVAPGGAIWVASRDGLFRSEDGQRFAAVEGWPGSEPHSIWIDRDGSVYATSGDALYWRAPGGPWQREGQEVGLIADRLATVLRDAAGVLWVRSSLGLWSRAPGERRFVDHSSVLPALSERGRMLADREGRLWVPTRKGVMLFDGRAWTLIDRARGLPWGGARMVFEDREGTIWIGEAGIAQLLGRGLWRTYSTPEGLPGDLVWFVRRDGSGQLWAGTDRGLVRETPSGWALVPETRDHVIRTVAWREDGSMWAGGMPLEVLRFSPSGVLLERLGPEAGLAGQRIFALREDRDGRLWAATEAGLFESNESAGSVRFRQAPEPWAKQRIRSLLSDRAGRLWAAGAGGLAVRRGGTWRLFTQADGLRQTSVSYLGELASGEVCVAYDESVGASCFQPGEDALTGMRHLDESSGLSNGKVYSLGEDARGRLWVGTGNGMDVFTQGAVEHFGQAQGMPGDDCTANAFHADANGTVWVGTVTGLGRFDSAAYTGPLPPSPPVFISARLGEKDVLAGARTVDHTQNTLALRFRTPAFLDSRRLEHQVRLLPEEPEWIPVASYELRYGKLEPGAHKLELRARRRPGPWSEPAVLSFSIRPAFWQTGGFRALVMMTAAAGLALLLGWRGRVVRARSRQEAQARSEANFKALIEQLPDAIFVQREGRLVYANRAACALLGWASPAEKVGTAFDELIHPDDRASEAGRTRWVAATGERTTLREQRLLRKDGSAVPVEVSALAAELDEQRVVLSVARDVSEQKQLRRRLAISDRMASLGTLVAGIAHELNNPLSYVIANLQMIGEELALAREEDRAPAYLDEALRDARDGSERMRRIIAGLKTFSRGDTEVRRVLELGPVVALAVKITSHQTRQRATVKLEEQAVPAVFADEGRLTQVFINLLVNAAQAIPEGQAEANEIRVVLHSEPTGRAVVEVRDTGAGMSPEVLARAFDPFFTTKDVGIGTGLGLSICHGIITAMGGELTIESAPGKGTTARVVLPPAPAATTTPPGYQDTAPK
jgi:PAS domain S-box-containing protein